MKAKIININCCKCGAEIQRSAPAVYKAKRLGRNIYCKKCYDEIHNVGISLDDAIKIKGTKKWKGIVHFKCSICGNESTGVYCKIIQRKYGANLPICNKCILKYVTNLPEWKYNNSKSQKIAQNRPEQKLKNSKGVIEACKRESVKKAKSDAMRKKFLDPVYKAKILKNLCTYRTSDDFIEKTQRSNRFFNGYVIVNDNPLFYNSGWELAFIKYCVNNGYLISRCKERIPYMHNGEMHLYFPDFVVVKNGRKIIVEIKGRYNGSSELVKPKMDAAISFVKKSCKYDDYVLYYKEELIKIGIDISANKIKELKREADKSYEDYKKGLSR